MIDARGARRAADDPRRAGQPGPAAGGAGRGGRRLPRRSRRPSRPGSPAANLPHAFVGVIIALLVLLPETLAAARAARRDRVQISLNLALGSAMASIGLTIPAIAIASIWLDGPLLLGLGGTQMVLLALTVVVSVLTVVPGRANCCRAACTWCCWPRSSSSRSTPEVRCPRQPAARHTPRRSTGLAPGSCPGPRPPAQTGGGLAGRLVLGVDRRGGDELDPSPRPCAPP